MNSSNHLGLKIIGITLLTLLVLYGAHAAINGTLLKSISPKKSTDTNKETTENSGDIALKNISLKPGKFTKEYMDTLPADVSEENILDKQRLEAFIAQNSEPLLPSVDPDSLKTTNKADQHTTEKYLRDISSLHNPGITDITSSQIEEAFYLYSHNNKQEKLLEIMSALKSNIASLEEVETPVNIIPTHVKLISATQALLNNVTTLAKMEEDFVGSLMAAKNIEKVGEVFEELTNEIEALREE